MEDTYAYISIKLYLKDGQTKESVEDIVSEMDMNFKHDQIKNYDFYKIIDTQIPSKKSGKMISINRSAYVEHDNNSDNNSD